MKREKNIWLYSFIFSFFLFPLVVLSPRPRILEEDNYIAVTYGVTAAYSKWTHNKIPARDSTSYLSYNGQKLEIGVSFSVEPSQVLKIHFSDNYINSLENFFNAGYDKNSANIISVDLTNFHSSLLYSLGGMFSGCSNLVSINLLNFDTSKVEDMNSMFQGCSNLVSINLLNFDTSKVENMNSMFQGCSNLVSINLSNFDTSNVKKMDGMFNGCSKLGYLDISNFNFSSLEVGKIGVFKGADKIKYIRIYSIQNFQAIEEEFNYDGLIVCQKDEIITNKKAVYCCCDFTKSPLKCDCSNNYITVKYKEDTSYESYILPEDEEEVELGELILEGRNLESNPHTNNNNRDSISFIINQDKLYKRNEPLSIKSNSPIDIYFTIPITTLEGFFAVDFDDNSNKISYE